MAPIIILFNGFLKVAIYLIGLGFVAYYRRLMLVIGMALAAYVSAVRAFADASHPQTAVDIASFLGTFVAVTFVGSFIAAQRRGGRPRRWTP